MTHVPTPTLAASRPAAAAEDLIDVSQIIEKKIQLRKERVVLSSVVETALETCRSLIHGRGHRLQVNIPSEPVVLDADPVRLTQVLVNLLHNAAKFTDPGGQIWLSATRIAGHSPCSLFEHLAAD